MPRPRPLILLAIGALMLPLASCQPIGPTPNPARPDLLDERERQVAEAIERARGSAVALEYTAADAPSGARRVATGVMIDAQGYVLSIRIDPPSPGSPILARDASGRRLAVSWVATDPETGLTLLRIPPATGPNRPVTPTPAEPGREPARLGGEVIVIGNPFGLGHSVSRGHVAGLDRRLELGPKPLGGLIQVDASLHPGDSGALLANVRGEWLGLIRSGLTTPDADHARDHDLGFAIPARDALWVADRLRAHRRVDRAYLGVRLDLGGPADPDGALLDDVVTDGPAGLAGLQPGDRVVALDGHPIRTAVDLTDRLDRTPAEADATVDYRRGPHLKRLIVRTASRPKPKDESGTPGRSSLGKSDDAQSPLSHELAKRVEQLERRLEALEQRTSAEKDKSEKHPPIRQARGEGGKE